MNATASVLAGLGGVITFCGAVYVLIRGVGKMVDANERNTRATDENTQALKRIDGTVSQHDGRIRSLEDWRKDTERKT